MRFLNIIHQNNKLLSLAIRDTPLDHMKPQLLANYINCHCRLRFLILERNNFDITGLNVILQAFKSNKHMIHLSLRHCLLQGNFLAFALHNLRALVSLDLSYSNISQSLVFIKLLAKYPPYLRYLSLSHSHFDQLFDFPLVLTSLRLYELTLDKLALCEYGFQTIAEAMKYGRNS